MSCPKKTKGFTLIELMISITVMAILASIGFIVYSQAQATSRDARRKSDLKAFQGAFELYYQKNGKYPPSSWSLSCQTTGNNAWITPTNPDPALDSNYINYIPHDPMDTNCSSNPSAVKPDQNIGNYSYLYDGRPTNDLNGARAGCNKYPDGQWYYLLAQLETKNDQNSLANNPPIWCDGLSATANTNVFGSSMWPYLYVVTSQ